MSDLLSEPDGEAVTGDEAAASLGAARTSRRAHGGQFLTRLPPWTGAVALLVLLSGITVGGNLWWIVAHRGGLPLQIDEAGYLERAVRNADALHSGGLVHLVRVVRQPDPQAPLLPVTAGFWRQVTGAGPSGLLGVEQVFAVILVAATYLLARRFASRRWAVLAAIVAVTLPGVVDNGRIFEFALPATAFVTATLAAQLFAEDFRSPRRALLWGLLLGLTSLTRTMVLGFIGVLVLAAAIRLLAKRAGTRQWRNAAGAVAVGTVVALSWYSATWRQVARYLGSYGYGVQAAGYGHAGSLWSLHWWTAQIHSDRRFGRVLPVYACFVHLRRGRGSRSREALA